MISELRDKIIKINYYSIFIVVLIFSALSFGFVYFVMKKTFDNDITFAKREYFLAQKLIIKNEVNNFVNFISHIRQISKQEAIQNLKKNTYTLSKILAIVPPKDFKYILEQFKKRNPNLNVALSDTKAHPIFVTVKDYNKKDRMNFFQSLKKGEYFQTHTKYGTKYAYGVVFRNKIDNKKYVIGNSIYLSSIDEQVKKVVLSRVNSIHFGTKQNGYISIAHILNYKGGDKFAKVVALPIKPSWVGKYASSYKKDAKGKRYREEYLHLINTKGYGYVSYWFYKRNTKELKPKISFVKLYKPYDWIIVGGVYMDDIYGFIHKKQQELKKELQSIFVFYISILIVILIISHFIVKYENNILMKIVKEYEKELDKKNQELRNLNKHLQLEVNKKTKELLKSFLTDPLTGLPNREKLLVDFESQKYVALLNVDSFKEINDFYGIEIGDMVLKEISKTLSKYLELYKMAGDEFAVLGNDLDVLIKKIRDVMDVIDKTQIHINEEVIVEWAMSCGVGESLSQADMALKYAKNKKTERVVVFDENLPIYKEYENNLKWRELIKQAIKNDKILPFVQPIVDNLTKQIKKYECLIRLEHNGEIFSPYFFLEISKKTGQYQKLQKIMIEKCFAKFSNLEYKFSINLSTIDLDNVKFRKYFLDMVDKFDIKDKLIVELLEDDDLLNDDILHFLLLLSKKGIEVAIDDFGSGYSNFSYLVTKLPVNILKIDGSLVKFVATSDKHYRLLKSIVMMAKEFDLSIVAEFVEDEQIEKILGELHVDYSQGYFFSKPFDIREL